MVKIADDWMHLPDIHMYSVAPYLVEGKLIFQTTCTCPLKIVDYTINILILGKTQVRFSHTDVTVPDFSPYRRDVSQDPGKPNTSEISRRAFTYLMVAGMGVTGLHAGKNVVIDFVSSMSASADVLALAKIEVDLSTIPEGTLYICNGRFTKKCRW